jgi:hypothetical protein
MNRIVSINKDAGSEDREMSAGWLKWAGRSPRGRQDGMENNSDFGFLASFSLRRELKRGGRVVEGFEAVSFFGIIINLRHPNLSTTKQPVPHHPL